MATAPKVSVCCLDAILGPLGHLRYYTPEPYTLEPRGRMRTCAGYDSPTCRFSALVAVGSRRLGYGEALVDIVTTVVETLWAPLSQGQSTTCVSGESVQTTSPVVPTRTFIREIMHRSQTTYTTMQTAMLYLFQAQAAIAKHCLQQQCSPRSEDQPSSPIHYITCGRRMFLASLIVASKYVQDKTYRNSAWASIARVPVQEINMAEHLFLDMVEYRLYVHGDVFDAMHTVLCKYVRLMTADPDLVYLYSLTFGAPTMRTTAPPMPSTAAAQQRASQWAPTAFNAARAACAAHASYSDTRCLPTAFSCIMQQHQHQEQQQQQQQQQRQRQRQYQQQQQKLRLSSRRISRQSRHRLSHYPSSIHCQHLHSHSQGHCSLSVSNAAIYHRSRKELYPTTL